MTGLRERQKADRTRRILEIARQRFPQEGYEAVTMESLAAEAGTSAVTVYNHFGSKAGVLLALVRESDQRLLARLESIAADPPEELTEGIARVAQTIRWHALTWLSKATWRQIAAASLTEGSAEFGRIYRALDAELIRLIARVVAAYVARGALPAGTNADRLGATLFALQNMRFFEFIADDSLTDAQADRIMRADLAALFGGR